MNHLLFYLQSANYQRVGRLICFLLMTGCTWLFGTSSFNMAWGQNSYSPPDILEGTLHPPGCFWPNQGQLRHFDYSPALEFQFHTLSGSNNLLASSGRLSFSHWGNGKNHLDPDTFQRLDLVLSPSPEVAVNPIVWSPVSYTMSVFKDHCSPTASGMHGFQRLAYVDVHPGIDVVVETQRSGPVVFFVLHPGSDANDLKFRFEGHDSLKVVLQNSMKLFVDQYTFRIPQLLAYQVSGQQESQPLPWTPTLVHQGGGSIQMLTGAYNPQEILVLRLGGADPVPPTHNEKNDEWSTTFMGSGSIDVFHAITHDQNNNVYAVGETNSANFLTTLQFGSIQTFNNGDTDGLITKFNQDGELLYINYYGGGFSDGIYGVAVDDNENAFVLGRTNSNNLVTVPFSGAYYDSDLNGNGYDDLFLCRINPSGDSLLWATYFGTDSIEYAVPNSLIFDGDSGLYFCANTFGTAQDWIYDQPGAYYQDFNAGGQEGLVAHFNLQGQRKWVSYLGSQSYDELTGLILDDNGHCWVTGHTNSSLAGNNLCGVPSNGGFPLCDAGGPDDYFQDAHGGASDWFVTEFDPQGSLLYSSFLGGSGIEAGASIAAYQNRIFLLGSATASPAPASNAAPCLSPAPGELPLCSDGSGYFEPNHAGGQDVLIGAMDDHDLVWLSYFGGSESERAYHLTNDLNGTLYLSGEAVSWDFPTKPFFGFFNRSIHNNSGEPQPAGTDIFFSSFDSNFDLRWSTFYGGTNDVFILPEAGRSLTVTPSEKLFAVGSTNSTSGQGFHFFCPGGSFLNPYCEPQDDQSSNDNAFIVRFDISNILSVSDLPAKAGSLQVAPNPSNDWVLLNWSAPHARGNLDLFASDGRKMRHWELQGGNQEIKIDVSYLTKGVYVLRWTDDHNTLSTKLLKR